MLLLNRVIFSNTGFSRPPLPPATPSLWAHLTNHLSSKRPAHWRHKQRRGFLFPPQDVSTRPTSGKNKLFPCILLYMSFTCWCDNAWCCWHGSWLCPPVHASVFLHPHNAAHQISIWSYYDAFILHQNTHLVVNGCRWFCTPGDVYSAVH